MKNLLRLACVVSIALALTGALIACGDDDNKTSSTNTTAFTPTSGVSATSGPVGQTSTSSGGAVSQNVTDGAACSTPNARGVTQGGQAMLCSLVGTEYRWRPA